jgi:hypothetical protein
MAFTVMGVVTLPLIAAAIVVSVTAESAPPPSTGEEPSPGVEPSEGVDESPAPPPSVGGVVVLELLQATAKADRPAATRPDVKRKASEVVFMGAPYRGAACV